ncbi:MAG: hypothetical protein U1C59_02775 [Methylotenera sp.]|nr:hypothetical protein [Methylotenera sp.]
MPLTHKTFKLPLSLVLLDMIGVVLIGLGVTKMFAGVDLLPADILQDEQGWLLIIAGLLLMIPLLLHLLVSLRARAEEKLVK